MGSFVVEKLLHHDARFAWVPQPKRSCRHLLLDHLNLHGGCHDVLLDGKHERFPPWRTSLNVGALVTLVAAVHYFYMREFWITIGTSPILYRYIDWSITVPLQM